MARRERRSGGPRQAPRAEGAVPPLGEGVHGLGDLRRAPMIRRARPDDVDFLVELYSEPDVRPFLAGGHDFGRDAVAAEVERSEREPDAFGRFVIEVDGEPAGALGFERTNE